MDLYDIVTHIPHIFLVLMGFAIVTQVYFGGILNMSLEIDTSQRDQFRKTIVLENTLNVEASNDELKNIGREYERGYDHRRAYIPVEFFIREDQGSGVGYKKKNGNCFIERVSGLDGQHFGFYIKPMASTGSTNLDCTGTVNRGTAVYSPVLLVRKAAGQPLLPARLYVYEIQ